MITGMQSKMGLSSRGYGAPSNPHRGKRYAAMQPVLEWGPNTLSINRAEQQASVRRISPRFVQVEELMQRATGLQPGSAYGYGGGFGDLGDTMVRGGVSSTQPINPMDFLKTYVPGVKLPGSGSDPSKKPKSGGGSGGSVTMTRDTGAGTDGTGVGLDPGGILPEGLPSWALPVGVAVVAAGVLWWVKG